MVMDANSKYQSLPLRSGTSEGHGGRIIQALFFSWEIRVMLLNYVGSGGQQKNNNSFSRCCIGIQMDSSSKLPMINGKLIILGGDQN